MFKIRHTRLQLVVMVLAALSFVLLGAVHRLPASITGNNGYAGVDIAAYMLPDGTLPDLCSPSTMDDKSSGGMRCLACMLAKSAGIVAPIRLPLPDGELAAGGLPLRSDAPLSGHASPAPPARGPPVARLA